MGWARYKEMLTSSLAFGQKLEVSRYSLALLESQDRRQESTTGTPAARFRQVMRDERRAAAPSHCSDSKGAKGESNAKLTPLNMNPLDITKKQSLLLLDQNLFTVIASVSIRSQV